eukprot:gene16164-20658_t
MLDYDALRSQVQANEVVAKGRLQAAMEADDASTKSKSSLAAKQSVDQNETLLALEAQNAELTANNRQLVDAHDTLQ